MRICVGCLPVTDSRAASRSRLVRGKSPTAHFPVDVKETRAKPFGPEASQHRLARVFSEPRAQDGVAEQAPQSGGECVSVAGRDAEGVVAVPKQLGRSPGPRGHDRLAAGHRFHDRQPERLRPGARVDDNVEGPERRGRVVLESEEADPPFDSPAPGQTASSAPENCDPRV